MNRPTPPYCVYEVGDEWPLERVTDGRTVLPRYEGAVKVRVTGYIGVADGADSIKQGYGEYQLELLDEDDNVVGKRLLPPHRMQANVEDNGMYTIIVPGGDSE